MGAAGVFTAHPGTRSVARVELIDRSVYSTRLTHAGQVFYEQALTLLSQMRETRTLLRGQSGAPTTTIEFAVPHTLSLTFFPRWLQHVETLLASGQGHERDPRPLVRTRLRALNVHDALLSLVEGGCDLVMGYHHPSHPVTLDPARYDMLVLGHEAISPFSAPHPDHPNLPRHPLPVGGSAVAPFLAYTPNAYLGRMTAVIIANSRSQLGFDKVYETDMAAAQSDGDGRAWHYAFAAQCSRGRNRQRPAVAAGRADRGRRGEWRWRATSVVRIAGIADDLAGNSFVP